MNTVPERDCPATSNLPLYRTRKAGQGYHWDWAAGKPGFQTAEFFSAPAGYVEVRARHHGYHDAHLLAARIRALVELLHRRPELIDDLAAGRIQVGWEGQVGCDGQIPA